MSLWQLLGCALLLAMLSLLIRECGGKAAPICAACGGAMLLVAALSRVSEPVAWFMQLGQDSALSPYLSVILRVLGVGYAVQLCADLCRDLGESSLAAKVEFVGRAEILLLALPLLRELTETAIDLL